MATLVPWTTVGIGDLDVFSPMLPSLVVYTWYLDDKPESSITYFWRDENTGAINHELVLIAPVPFEDAVAQAREESSKRNVERIHVKHARSANRLAGRSKTKRAAKPSAAQPKKRVAPKPKAANLRTGKRKQLA